MPLLLLLPLLIPNAVRAEGPPLTLDEAIRLAVSPNERALASGERLEAAEARVSKARAFSFPDVQAAGNYTRRPFERTSTVGGQEVILSKRDAFSSSITARQLLFDARARFEAEITSSNVTRAELELATAEREAIRAHDEEQTSRLALANLLVAPVPARLDVPVALLSPPAGARDRRQRPRGDGPLAPLRRGGAEKARGGIPLRREGAVEPALSEPRRAGRRPVDERGGLNARNTTWTYGLDLSSSLFDSATRFADRRERSANARAADLNARARERGVELDVKTALASFDLAPVAAVLVVSCSGGDDEQGADSGKGRPPPFPSRRPR